MIDQLVPDERTPDALRVHLVASLDGEMGALRAVNPPFLVSSMSQGVSASLLVSTPPPSAAAPAAMASAASQQDMAGTESADEKSGRVVMMRTTALLEGLTPGRLGRRYRARSWSLTHRTRAWLSRSVCACNSAEVALKHSQGNAIERINEKQFTQPWCLLLRCEWLS